MTTQSDVVVIGAGIGGLSSAILLGAAGLKVHVLERAQQLGGKAGTVTIDGVEVDTGPSVLTLPHVFDDIFAAANMRRDEQLVLTQPRPAFRYVYRDGTRLDVFHHLDETLESVRSTLGAGPAEELKRYLTQAQKIWEAAAPHFVFGKAPDLAGLLFGGFSQWGALSKIDAFRSLSAAISSIVTSPHLQMLLSRYATYNGSDARKAPATLGCIAHVELSLGGYGVKGGMVELVRALERAAQNVGVRFHLGAHVEHIIVHGGAACGVVLESGETFTCRHIVSNADASHLARDLLPSDGGLSPPEQLSMSAHTGILRQKRLVTATGSAPARPAHTVLFPKDYGQEFRDIFDAQKAPSDPTIYLCAQESCHGRPGWDSAEPVFCMINAPSMEDFTGQESGLSVQERMLTTLSEQRLLSDGDQVVWWRTPAELAARFPGSHGSLYGAASNSMTSAFRRPQNRLARIPGLYLASGSAHPGGGVPMVALSGKQAARLVLRDRRVAA